MIYKKDGVIFDINSEHLIDGVNYPSNWFQNVDNRIVLGLTEEADPEPIPLTQEERDRIRFMNRAATRDKIIANFATNNMSRVRAGVWTVDQLVSLTMDAELKLILDDISMLSYEIAYAKVDSITNPLITVEIKAEMKGQLLANFFL